VANTSREASVKLTLDNGQFIVSMRQVGDVVDKETKKASRASQMWGAGISSVGDKLKSIGGEVKRLASMAGTLGGAFTLGGAAHAAIKLETSYRNLAFAVRAGTGEAVNFKALMRDGQAIATKWSRYNDEVADTVKSLYEEVGDIGFAKKGAEEVAKAATATGASMGTLSSIAGTLNEKFDVTAEQLPDALATVVSAANKGGASLEGMGEKLGVLGASAKLAGLSGVEGFGKVVALLNVADNATGSFKKSLTAVTGVLDTLGDPEKVKKMEAQLGTSLRDKKGGVRADALERIVQRTGGQREKVEKVFGGEQAKLLVELGKSYASAFKETTGDVKTKTAAGIAAYREALDQASKSQLTAADMAKQAQENLETPQAKFQTAMNTLEAAMHKPEIIKAMNALAAALPKLADVIAKVIGWVADNPMTAAGGVAGAMVGKSFLEGALSKAGTSFAEQAFGGGIVGKAGGGFAAAAFGPVVIAAAAFALGSAIGNAVQDAIEASHAEKRKAAGDKLQAEIDEAQGMSEQGAVEKFGEKGRRYKRGELTDKERLQLAVKDSKTDFDAQEAANPLSRKFENEAQVRAMGFDAQKLGANAPMSALDLVKMNKAGMVGDDAVKDIKQIVPTGMANLNAAMKGGAMPGGPPEVEIKNTATFAQSLANALKGSTLKVEISNPPGGVGTRGAPAIPPPRPGGG
jgi:TP901 family phage tail tape measure protein